MCRLQIRPEDNTEVSRLALGSRVVSESWPLSTSGLVSTEGTTFFQSKPHGGEVSQSGSLQGKELRVLDAFPWSLHVLPTHDARDCRLRLHHMFPEQRLLALC